MHWLHLTPYYAPAYAFGGVVRAVEGLTQALARRGHQVTVLTTDAGERFARLDAPPEAMRQGVRVLRLPNRWPALRGRLNLSTPQGLGRALDARLPDVDGVHVHEFRTLENLLALQRVARAEKPLVLSPHGTLKQSTGRGAAKKLWDALFSPGQARLLTRVVALSDGEAEDVRHLWARWGLEAPLSQIPNGVDPAPYQHLPDPAPLRARYGLGAARIVLFMGRLHARKGVEALLRAFLAADLGEARLLMVGPDEGMLPTLRALADERVIFTGYLAGEARLMALAAADVFVLPAVGEGLSMASLEALAAGVPVILSPGCYLPEAASYGAGIVTEPTVSALTEALEALFSDAERHQRMRQRARHLIAQRFTWDAVAARYEALYEAVLA